MENGQITKAADLSENRLLLESALAALSGYRTLQCGQNHEKIVEIAKAEAIGHEKSHDDYLGWSLQTKGLCSPELRNSTLGCSHNTVLVNYNRLIRNLIAKKAIEENALPLQEINDVIAKIYIMDHEKGKLEKHHAVLKKGMPDTKQAEEETAQRIHDLRQEHVELVKELELLHQDVLKELTRLIKI